jgi:hypothetical protein
MLNAQTKNRVKILLRFCGLHCDHVKRSAAGQKPFSIVKAKLVDVDGNYCGFEQYVWGDSEHERTKQAQLIMQKFQEGHVFVFSEINNLRGVKPEREFFTVNQVIKNVPPNKKDSKPSFVASPVLKGSKHELMVPTHAISKLQLADLGKMESGRIVDMTAILLEVIPGKTPGPEATLMLSDNVDWKFKCNIWNQLPEHVKYEDIVAMVGKIVCVQQVYVGIDPTTNKVKEFTAGPQTTFCSIPSGNEHPRVKHLESMQAEVLTSTQSAANVKEYVGNDPVDHSQGEAIEISIAMLALLSDPKYETEEQLFQLPIVTSELSSNISSRDDLLTKDGSRLFFPVEIRDHSGTLEVRMSEKVALILTQLETQDKFIEAWENSELKFMRGAVRILRQSSSKQASQSTQESKPQYINMIAVAAEPRLCFASRPCTAFTLNRNGANVMPATLNKLRFNSLNSFEIIGDNGEIIQATHVLLFLQCDSKGKAIETVKHNEGFAVKHKNVICMGGPEPYATSIDTFTVTNLAKVQEYQLSKQRPYLCLITSATVDSGDNLKELFISEMWTPEQISISDAQAAAYFRAEYQSSMRSFAKTPKKRRADMSPDDIKFLFTPNKENPKVGMESQSTQPDATQ